MALINKIRERSGIAIGIIALSLGAFVLLGDFFGSKNSLFGGVQSVGEIAGEEIAYNEFQATLDIVEANYAAQNGKQATETEMPALRDQAWNQLIFKKAFQKEFDRLGMEVSDEELADMVQGNNVHPAIKQAFVNPQTKEFDRTQVVNYLKNFDKLEPQQKAMWANFESNLGPDRLRVKFENLLKQSNYITTAEAKHFHEAQNAKASLKYLYVPFFTISDSTVKVTDEELEAYLDKNKGKYKAEEGRSISYVAIPVSASKEDSAAVRKDLEEMAEGFRTTESDSMFVRANSDAPFNNAYLGMGELPQAVKDKGVPQKGKVYGPIIDNGTYKIIKISNVKSDTTGSARASHILFKASAETDEAKAEALKKAKEVLAQIKGGASFEEMARQHGTDGTASVGGDLGWFSQGRMVKEFEKAVFSYGKTGLLPEPVKTQFGYHIIKVTEPVMKQRFQVASIERNIGSSDETKDAAFRKADQLAGTSKDLASFKKNVAADKTLTLQEAKNLGRSDRNVNNLQSARELVRWAYNDETAPGTVSPVFEAGDFYVVAVLTGKREKGKHSIDDMREELTAAVRNEKKGQQILAKLKNAKGSNLDEMAKAYGQDAVVRSADNVTFGGNYIEGLGAEAEAIGKAFSLKPGKRTAPFAGQTGVMVLEMNSLTPAEAPTDLKAIKQQMQQQQAMRIEGNVYEAVKESAGIKDNRSRYF